jgi:hypothetical protein
LPPQELAFLLDFGLQLLKLSLLRCYCLLNQFEIPHTEGQGSNLELLIIIFNVSAYRIGSNGA